MENRQRSALEFYSLTCMGCIDVWFDHHSSTLPSSSLEDVMATDIVLPVIFFYFPTFDLLVNTNNVRIQLHCRDICSYVDVLSTIPSLKCTHILHLDTFASIWVKFSKYFHDFIFLPIPPQPLIFPRPTAHVITHTDHKSQTIILCQFHDTDITSTTPALRMAFHSVVDHRVCIISLARTAMMCCGYSDKWLDYL